MTDVKERKATYFFPIDPENRLDLRMNHIDLVGSRNDEGWDLLDEWRVLNGLRDSEFFGPHRLSGKRSGTLPPVWNGEHGAFFKRKSRPTAILKQPYNTDGFVEELLGIIEPLGLVLHTPPNPCASFWYPGATLFLVITRPDFGEVQWLPDQITFRHQVSGRYQYYQDQKRTSADIDAAA